jgi:hypothetical protein
MMGQIIDYSSSKIAAGTAPFSAIPSLHARLSLPQTILEKCQDNDISPFNKQVAAVTTVGTYFE